MGMCLGDRRIEGEDGRKFWRGPRLVRDRVGETSLIALIWDLAGVGFAIIVTSLLGWNGSFAGINTGSQFRRGLKRVSIGPAFEKIKALNIHLRKPVSPDSTLCNGSSQNPT